MDRVSVDISDALEKKLRFKTVERFGGRKGDLSRAVEEAVKTWIACSLNLFFYLGRRGKDSYLSGSQKARFPVVFFYLFCQLDQPLSLSSLMN
jgi:hypothetical protein